jgi:polar amino acid transport system permease protein
MNRFADAIPFLLWGIPVTLAVTVLAIGLAIPAALVMALGRGSHWWFVRWPSAFVIEVFRGTSAPMQLFWAFYVLPFFGITITPLEAAVLVLGLNEASYFSEVVRAALATVAAGQRDAVVALHLPRFYRFFRIVLPQALPLMMPPFGNSVVGMLKFSALASLVTLQELSFRAGMVRSTLGDSGKIYSFVLLVYFAISLLLTFANRRLERRVNDWAGRPRPASSARGRRRASPVPAWALGR